MIKETHNVKGVKEAFEQRGTIEAAQISA